MRISRSGFLERRGIALLVFGVFVAGGLVFIFAGTLARANELEAEAAAARADLAQVQALLELGAEEIEFVKTDAFVQQHARREGYGEPNEILIQLPADAPSPPPIIPIGSPADGAIRLTPMDAWIELLFG